MVISCSAYNCTNRFKALKEDGTQFKFHRFPFQKPLLLKKWIIAVRRENWLPSKYAVLCGDHFSEDAYKPPTRRFLKEYAVPSVFNFSSRMQKMERKRTVPVRHPIKILENKIKDEVLCPVTTIPFPPISDDNCSETIDTHTLRNHSESTTVEEETKEKIVPSADPIPSLSTNSHCPELIVSNVSQNNNNFILVALTNGKVVTCPVKVKPPSGYPETDVLKNPCPVNVPSSSTDICPPKLLASGISNINSNSRRRGKSPTKEALKSRIKRLEKKLCLRDRKIRHLESLLKEKKHSVSCDSLNSHKNTSEQLPYLMICQHNSN